MSDKKNVETAIDDVLAYYDKRTDEQNLKSITAKIAKIRKEVDELTDAFVKAKSALLQNTIETKMCEYEVLLNDLETQKAQLELERGYRLTKQDLIVFVEELLKGDVNDKDYQKQIIDHLVSQVFVSDDNTVVYFNIRGGKNIETITFADNKAAVENLTKVQTQLPLSRQSKPKSNGKFGLGFFVMQKDSFYRRFSVVAFFCELIFDEIKVLEKNQ